MHPRELRSSFKCIKLENLAYNSNKYRKDICLKFEHNVHPAIHASKLMGYLEEWNIFHIFFTAHPQILASNAFNCNIAVS